MRLRQFLLTLAVPVLLVVVGTTGFTLIEGWPLADCLYMTVITITTVGFMEVHPLSPGGRLFTGLLALGGVFTLLYAATSVIRAVVSGEIGGTLGRQRMERKLADLTGHAIICGYGRMGRLVCSEFSSLAMPFVIVDQQASLLADFREPHGIALVGDATDDHVLRKAGVERAKVLVTVAASDAANLYITMSARLLSEKLFIVARSEESEAEPKLLRAGANRVVSPYVIGGLRMAQAVLRPNVMDFIELATRRDYLELQIEELTIENGSALAGRSLKDSRVRQDLGVIIVAIKRPDGKMVFNPPSEEAMQAGDLLITLGHRDQLERLETLARA
ncbi:MAG TPA: potassium channel protein [Vicinamibacteria bacterium]|nr:potassium channel protein [Vicinamibacteria bacterium]